MQECSRMPEVYFGTLFTYFSDNVLMCGSLLHLALKSNFGIFSNNEITKNTTILPSTHSRPFSFSDCRTMIPGMVSAPCIYDD